MTTPTPAPIRIELETREYNTRRYGKPWIAKVDFSQNPKGDFSFGDWIGDAGSEGILRLININPGDIIAKGQKDTYKPAYSAPKYFLVGESGELTEISKATAYKMANP